MFRIRSGAFKYGVGALAGGKRPRRIGIRKVRERGGELCFACIKSRPGVPVKMIDDRPGMQQLPDASHVFARNAEDHIEQFIQAKGLPNERTHGHVSGFFLCVADGNRFRERHDARIRGRRLKSRYEKEDNCLKTGELKG
jgi:hypothetical protein